jgi:hypothetical protein
MKTITVNVSEPVYRDFMEHARQQDRTAAELIREAMEAYRNLHIRPRPTLKDRKALSLGRVRKPLTSDDDVLGEMLDAGR